MAPGRAVWVRSISQYADPHLLGLHCQDFLVEEVVAVQCGLLDRNLPPTKSPFVEAVVHTLSRYTRSGKICFFCWPYASRQHLFRLLALAFLSAGSIPRALGDLTALEVLEFNNNQLSGECSSFGSVLSNPRH